MAKAIRDVYGEALVKYGKDDERVVVLVADVSSSTKSAGFGQACPAGVGPDLLFQKFSQASHSLFLF